MNKKHSLPKFIKKCAYDGSKTCKSKSISLDLKERETSKQIKFLKKN